MNADHSGTVWRDDMWLQTYPLNAHTALDYFSCSPFWDAACNNVRARLEQKQLRDLQGIEYALDTVQEPHLFVISKHQRQSADAASPLMFFYILDGSLYQTPTLHAALHARLSRCTHQIKHAFTTLQSDLDPMRKAVPALGCTVNKQPQQQTATPPEPVASNSEWQSVDPYAIGRILSHVVRKNAVTAEGEKPSTSLLSSEPSDFHLPQVRGNTPGLSGAPAQ